MMKQIKYGIPEGEEIRIESMKVTYSQCADTNSTEEDDQYLTIETQNVCLDEPYYNLSTGNPDTNNGHWSFNEPEELLEVIRDFKARLGLFEKNVQNEIKEK